MFVQDSGCNNRSRQSARMWAPVPLLLLLLLALMLAGCGAAGATGSGGAAAATPTATHHPAGTAVRPCPGPYGSASSVQPAPAVLLTGSTPNRSATAHAGDVVQVRLPSTSRWSYQSAHSSTTPELTLLQPAGIQDITLNDCVWNFMAQSAGTATLDFEGMPNCDVHVPCPQNIVELSFTVTVS